MDDLLIASYQEYIDEFVTQSIDNLAENLQVIILHGGLARDRFPIPCWSDIDLIVICSEYNLSVTKSLSKIISNIERKSESRLDVNLIYSTDIATDRISRKFYHSEIINALNKRNIVVLYGALDNFSCFFDEYTAVYAYINNTLILLRKYYFEKVYKDLTCINCKAHLQRIVRWVFSIIRSSLRLYNIYVNPYQESLNEIKKINFIENKHIQLIDALISIRSNYASFDDENIDYFIELFSEIENFIEFYTNKIREISIYN